MNFFERRKILKKANLLELTPFRILGHEEDNELIDVLLPRFYSKFWGPKLQPLLAPHKKYIRIKFDQFGSETWRNIDGRKNVAQIATLLVEKFGEKIEPVDDRLGKFLSMLYEQRYISFTELKD